MDQHVDDYHDPDNRSYLTESEDNRWGRNARKRLALDLTWDYLITLGDKTAGYRYPLNALADAIATDVLVSRKTAEDYLKEFSSDSPLSPFVREWVTVNGSPTLHLRPKHVKALRARLELKAKGGANA